MLDKTLTLILAGGEGSRLAPLSKDRAKPAVPFGGKYRIIDFCLSNCLHSGLRKILVLSQYKSHSLQKHLRDGWSVFNPELGEYITMVPPQMRTDKSWYAGTANAVYQNLYLVERNDSDYVLILSADHIYRMDYEPMIRFHKEQQANITVACMEVPIAEATQFGVMQTDSVKRVVSFIEKPDNPVPSNKDGTHALASMGIYVFSKSYLLKVLEEDQNDINSQHDFGKNIIPNAIHKDKVMAYLFGGNEGRVSCDRYWRDVGTIDAYFKANLDLLKHNSPLDLYQEAWPIRTYSGQFPPARTTQGELGNEGIIINSIVDSGTVIAGGSVQNSVLFHKVYVDDEASVQESILFSGVRVGKGAKLRRCIIDKHVSVPEGEEIGFDLVQDKQRFTVSSEGVVVVPSGYVFKAAIESKPEYTERYLTS